MKSRRRSSIQNVGPVHGTMSATSVTLPPREVLEHPVDVHCHSTEELEVSVEAMRELPFRICAMSSNFDDQEKVEDLYNRYSQKVSSKGFRKAPDLATGYSLLWVRTFPLGPARMMTAV